MAKIQFAKPYYNVDSSANTVATEEAWNVYFEPLPQGGYAVRRRPGLTLLNRPTLTAAGDGIYWSDRTQVLYIVNAGVVFKKVAYNSNIIAIDSIGNNGYSVVFAEGQMLDTSNGVLYFSNGGALNYLDMATDTISAAVSSPATNTFVAMMNNRFYCNDTGATTNQDFYITDVDPAGVVDETLFWAAATNPWKAEQKPDPIIGIYTGWNEVYVWGTSACEVWQEDGVGPISPLVGSLMEIGLAAPYSVQKANNTFYALTTVGDKRAVVTIAGRGPNVISEPIARQLQSYRYVFDAIGMMCFAGGLNMYILSFPTEGVTWAYDIKTECWSQWSSWDLKNGQHLMFDKHYSTYAKTWNAHLMLSTSGYLYEVTRDSYTDAGAPIRSSIRTGWIDHGTWDRKRCDQLIVKLKGYLSSDAKVLMYIRSDGQPEWSVPIEIDIQAGEQNEHFCKLNRMGTYRSRQYEFVMTDAQDLALIGMEEDFTRMRN